jgi:hypothetical protein
LSHHSEPYVPRNPFENVLPRLLTIKQTASYWGVSPNSFRKLVQNGIAPGPVHTPGLNRLLFGREQQDRAIDACGKRAEVA